MQTSAFKRHALVPKPSGVERRKLPAIEETELAFLLGSLAPDERKALAAIVETADLIQVGGSSFLLAPVTPAMLDTLAAFGECEERENDLEDEPSEDPEPDTGDHEPSLQSCGGSNSGQDRQDLEFEPTVAPEGAAKSYEAFRAREFPTNVWRRGMAEIQRLNRFLRSRGKQPVSTFSIVGRP